MRDGFPQSKKPLEKSEREGHHGVMTLIEALDDLVSAEAEELARLIREKEDEDYIEKFRSIFDSDHAKLVEQQRIAQQNILLQIEELRTRLQQVEVYVGTRPAAAKETTTEESG